MLPIDVGGGLLHPMSAANDRVYWEHVPTTLCCLDFDMEVEPGAVWTCPECKRRWVRTSDDYLLPVEDRALLALLAAIVLAWDDASDADSLGKEKQLHAAIEAARRTVRK